MKIKRIKPNRSLFIPRVKLRRLFILITLACLWLGWMSYRNRQVELEQAAIDRIESYTSDSSYRYADRPQEIYDRTNRRPGPQLLSNAFNAYPFVDLVKLEFGYSGKIIPHLDDVGKLTHLEELDIGFLGDISSVEPLSKLRRLEKLTIHHATSIETLEPLQNCTRLESLEISFAKLTDIQVARKFPDLKSIRLLHTGVVNLGPLGSAKKLNSVDVEGPVRSIAGLENATEIETLYIRSPILKNFQALSGLKKVKRLSLRCDHLDSLDVISQMEDLEYCKIESKNLRCLDGIEHLPKLKVLSLYNCESLKNVQAIRGMNLESLSIRNYPPRPKFPTVLPLDDLSGIADLPRLENLDISNSSIRDFSSLGQLPQLTELTAKHCTKLRSLKGVNKLASLRRLELNQCFSLPSLEGLAGLSRLEIIGCYKCSSLIDVSELQNLPLIRRANFYQSPNVIGGPFLLQMMPTAFIDSKTAGGSDIANYPSQPFLNFEGTNVDGDWIEKLIEKYPDFPVNAAMCSTPDGVNE